MSAPKPTPGPWSVAHSFRPGAQFTIHATIGKSTPFVVAETACIHKTWGDERANAELIASAPELAARIAALDTLLAEKQRQCDRLSTQLVALTAERNSVCADYISRVSELDKANAEIADYAIEVDRLRNAIRTAADWFARSTRTDDREQADDLRAALRDGSTE